MTVTSEWFNMRRIGAHARPWDQTARQASAPRTGTKRYWLRKLTFEIARPGADGVESFQSLILLM